MALSTAFPMWKEFFTRGPTVDSLNNNTGAVLRASLNPASTVASRFADAILFSDCCAIAYSSLPGHIFFLHHFQSLGNRILNPGSVRDVALFGLLDHTDVTLINTAITFQSFNVEIPKQDILFGISTKAQLDHDALFHSTADASNMVHVVLSGVVFLPPFLLNDLASLNCSETSEMFFQATQSIISWATTFAAEDSTAAAKAARLEQGLPILQWLWACHHQLIASTPLHPSSGPAEAQYRRSIHQQFIQHPHTTLAGLGLGSTNSVTAPLGSDQLTAKIAKIAVLFEQQATSTAEKNLLKTPGWDRINSQARRVVLWASSINTIDPQVEPTKELSDLLQCKSAGAAHQFVLDYFDANNRGKYVSLSAGLTSALWACILRGTSPGTPENLSVFFVPRRTPAGQAVVINHLAHHLKSVDGSGLDASDIKIATKQKIIIPADLQEYTHQIANFSLLLILIFGRDSVIAKSFQKVVDHATRHETEYEDRQMSCQNFFAKLLSFLDRRIQSFLDECSSANSFGSIDFSGLGFDNILRDVIDGTFRVDLPMAIQSIIPKVPTKQTPPLGLGPNVVTPPLKKQRAGEPAGVPWSPPPRGDPEINDNIHPAWKLLSGENYVNVFCKGIDRSKLPKLTICLNYHVRGSCHSLCDRVTSHCPAQTLDDTTKKAVGAYIAAVRQQYKTNNPS